MADLNEWRLEYPGTVLDFGVLATEYPMSVQVDIGDVDRTTQDQNHPNADGFVMGRDRLGGFALTFDLKALSGFFNGSATPWRDSLDMFGSFVAKWRADELRDTPGAYATLTNLDRNRLVYGRPRKIAPKMERLRKGIIGYLADFQAIGPDFYSAVEKSVQITPVPPVAGGFETPLVAPITTAVTGNRTTSTSNTGDLAAWPIIEFHGPGSNYSIELLDGGDVQWLITLNKTLKYDEVFTLDTRPWSRSATINGRPANGLVRGTQVEKCKIPVGGRDLRFSVKDESGTAFASVRWRDAYASL